MFGTASIPNRPTAKLVTVASAMLAMLLVSSDSSYWQGGGWTLVWHSAAYLPSALFAYFIAFHAPSLQVFWGWALTCTCALTLVLMLTEKSGLSATTSWSKIILQLLISYLFLLDRSVVEYRSKLRDFYQSRRNKAALDQSRLP
jgi:hypothetical protein